MFLLKLILNVREFSACVYKTKANLLLLSFSAMKLSWKTKESQRMSEVRGRTSFQKQNLESPWTWRFVGLIKSLCTSLMKLFPVCSEDVKLSFTFFIYLIKNNFKKNFTYLLTYLRKFEIKKFRLKRFTFIIPKSLPLFHPP